MTDIELDQPGRRSQDFFNQCPALRVGQPEVQVSFIMTGKDTMPQRSMIN